MSMDFAKMSQKQNTDCDVMDHNSTNNADIFMIFVLKEAQITYEHIDIV